MFLRGTWKLQYPYTHRIYIRKMKISFALYIYINVFFSTTRFFCVCVFFLLSFTSNFLFRKLNNFSYIFSSFVLFKTCFCIYESHLVILLRFNLKGIRANNKRIKSVRCNIFTWYQVEMMRLRLFFCKYKMKQNA